MSWKVFDMDTHFPQSCSYLYLKRCSENVDVRINGNGEQLSDLIFADDIILFAESEEHLDNVNQEGRKNR